MMGPSLTMASYFRAGVLISTGIFVLCHAPMVSAQSDLEALEEEVNRLRQRLEVLENAPRQSPNIEETRSAPRAENITTKHQSEDLTQAVAGTERVEQETEGTALQGNVELGGALRFNLVHRDFVDASSSKYGESGLDVFRLNVEGELNNILVSAEYRFYSYMNTIHHGWIGWEFDDTSQLQLGIHQVPFGLLPYAAHNAWFGVPYYLGLADDYDMGVKYVRQDGAWATHLAFYKNEELNDATDLGRYSFDLVRVGDHQNEETNTGNARIAYTFGMGSNCQTEVGVSAQLGQIYNAALNANGEQWAAAAHMDSRCGRWNFQLQGGSYQYSPEVHSSATNAAVHMGAFEGSYEIASEADLLVANVAYNFASPWRELDSIICYNDYSLLRKNGSARDSQINTTGCAIGSGPLFTYVDFILANNMPFFGAGSLGQGGDDEWHGRLNINVGFYW